MQRQSLLGPNAKSFLVQLLVGVAAWHVLKWVGVGAIGAYAACVVMGPC